MTTKKIIVRFSAIGLLAACSEPVVVPEAPQQEVEYEMPMGVVTASASAFEDASRGYTRAWVPPTGYFFYENLYSGLTFANEYTLTGKGIDAFFTKDTEGTPIHGMLLRQSDGTWVFSSKEETISIDVGDYYAYGFVPRDAADGASITRLPDDPASHTYADGAVLTIHGLKSVAADACVMIGAKEGFKTDPEIYYDGGYTDKNSNGEYDVGTDERINRVRRGDFSFRLNAAVTSPPSGSSDLPATPENYLFFLFDHLCSALVINMRVHPEYNVLRTIRLKEVRLQTATNSAITKKLMNVIVTLNATDGSDPISNIVYTPLAESGDSDGMVYKSSTDLGLTLTTELTNTSFLSHFIPKDVTKLVVTSTYDIYDKDTSLKAEGNLIRKDCTATNTIPLSLISYFSEAGRSKIYTLNMTIQPTYLYMMSDPDLNNPTVVVN